MNQKNNYEFVAALIVHVVRLAGFKCSVYCLTMGQMLIKLNNMLVGEN